ncbi:MAG: S41 family peptidase [Alistipes sp.]|nr:S41 family peptidase [Alistipes sp.]
MKNLFTLILFVCCIAANAQEPARPSAILTPEQKAFGLAKFWQEANYNFVFMDKVDRSAWDSTFQAMLPLAMQTENDYEYFLLLQKLCARLNDGHTYVWAPGISNHNDNPPDHVRIPIVRGLLKEGYLQLNDIGGLPVVETVSDNLSEQIPLGSIVTSVNGIPVEDHIRENTLPYVGQNTDHLRRIMSVRGILSGLDGERLSLGYIVPDGQERSIELTFDIQADALPVERLEVLDRGNLPWELIRYRELGNGIGYLQLNSFGSTDVVDRFKELYPQVRQAKAIIIDLRYNGGGNTNNGTAILQYFTPDSVLYGSSSRTRKHIAAYKAWGQFYADADTTGMDRLSKNMYLAARDELMEPLHDMQTTVTVPMEDRTVVPIVVLTGYWTASAAEDFLIFTDNQPHITRIGTKTFGSTGQPISVELPGGMFAAICSKNDTYTDGREFVGIGVIPHIEVIPNLEQMLAGRDVVLETAIEHLKAEI